MLLIEKIIKEAINKDASDIHLLKGLKPILRVNRSLIEIADVEPLEETDLYDVYDYSLSRRTHRRDVPLYRSVRNHVSHCS